MPKSRLELHRQDIQRSIDSTLVLPFDQVLTYVPSTASTEDYRQLQPVRGSPVTY